MQQDVLEEAAKPDPDGALPEGRQPALRPPRRLARAETLPLLSRGYLLLQAGAEQARIAFETERKRGNLFHFVPVVIGLGSIVWFRMEIEPALPALALAFVLLTGLAAFYAYRSTLAFRFLAGGALLVAGMLFSALESRRLSTIIIDAPITARLTGVIEQREQDGSGRWRYIVRVLAVEEPRMKRPPSRVALSVRARHVPLEPGMRITVRAFFSPPAGPALPGLNDFAFAAYHAGIGANAFAFGAPETFATEPATDLGESLSRGIADMRATITDRIRSRIPGDTGAFAAAIITGEQRGISREATEALRVSGLAHIVAVSGLNMALAAGLFFVGVRRFLSISLLAAHSYPIKKWAAAGAILAAFAYFLISGSQVSAERAFIMTSIMLFAVLIDRPALSMRNVALAALIILALTPSQIMGPSFQMSFAATAALIAAYGGYKDREHQYEKPVLPQLFPWLRPVIPVARILFGIAATSLVGGLSTAAFAAEHFQRLSGYSLAANLAAMPLVSVIVMPAAVIAMLAMPFGLDAWPFWLMALGLDVVLWVAREVASWGGALEIARLPPWFLPLFVCGFLLFVMLGTWFRHVGTIIMAGVLVLASVTPREKPGDLFVAENGSLVGLFDADRIATNKLRPNAFIFDQWRRAAGASDHVAPMMPRRISAAMKTRLPATLPGPSLAAESQQPANDSAETIPIPAVAIGRFSCVQKDFCVATSFSGWRIVSIDNPDLIAAACAQADLLIAGPRIRRAQCGESVRVFDRNSMKRSGSLEITLPDHKTIKIRSAFSSLTRPWHRHRLYNPASGRFADGRSLNDNGG